MASSTELRSTRFKIFVRFMEGQGILCRLKEEYPRPQPGKAKGDGTMKANKRMLCLSAHKPEESD